MSLRSYFKARDGLPDPRGHLSADLSSHTISSANREVEKALDLKKEEKKRGHYALNAPRAEAGGFLQTFVCGGHTKISTSVSG